MRYARFLEEYEQRLAEFPLLVATRSRLLELLNGRPEGIDREKLKTLVKHEGSTAFGVICNQLARGGWLRQEKNGKKYTLYPESTAPVSDEVFASQEIPPPDVDERPIEEQLAELADMPETDEIPEGWELWEADPIIPRPMTPELQALLDDARRAGYFVRDDHANGGVS
jgi:DNA-binding IclR family transcriptional regulator